MCATVVGKVKVRWDVTCGLGAETEEGKVVKVGSQVFCGFEEATSLEVATGHLNVDV